MGKIVTKMKTLNTQAAQLNSKSMLQTILKRLSMFNPSFNITRTKVTKKDCSLIESISIPIDMKTTLILVMVLPTDLVVCRIGTELNEFLTWRSTAKLKELRC